MADNDWKARLGVVYSTNPDFQYTTQKEEEAAENERGQLERDLDRYLQDIQTKYAVVHR